MFVNDVSQIKYNDVISSTIAEPDLSVGEEMFQTGQSYAKKKQVVFEHKIYSSAIDNNAYSIEDGLEIIPPAWVLRGASNKMAMFDSNISTKTQSKTTVTVEIEPDGGASFVSCFGVEGVSTIQVIVTAGGGDDVVYDKTVSMTGYVYINSYYSYMFTPLSYSSTVAFMDIPYYSTCRIKIIYTGNNILIGDTIVGKALDLGVTQFRVKGGIKDFSSSNRDEFGVLHLVKREVANNATFIIKYPDDQAQYIRDIISKLASRVTVWSATSDPLDPTLTLGICSSFVYDYNKDGKTKATIKILGVI